MSVIDVAGLFQAAGGSIVGTDHLGTAQVLLGKNNQDTYALRSSTQALIGVACDGCGSSAYSEVGSHIGGELLAERLGEYLPRCAHIPHADAATRVEQMLERSRQYVLAHLRLLALSMGGSFSQRVNDYFLFTVIGYIMTVEWTAIFSLGDGIYVLNDDYVRLEPMEGNQPIYMAYALTGSSLSDQSPELLQFKVHRLIETDRIQQLLVGTDGGKHFERIADKNVPGKHEMAGDIFQFFSEQYFSNPDAIRRRLAQLNTRRVRLNPERTGLTVENGLLPDDTTLLPVRRRVEKAGEQCTAT